MQKKIHIIILSVISILTFAFSSCKLYTSDNGDLDGSWHLLSINEEAVSHPDLYWNFQGHLLEIRDKSTDCGAFILRFSHEGNQLILSQPYIYDRTNGDKPLEDAAYLQPFGIDNLKETFEVISLNHSRMTLKSATKTLTFRKF